MTERQLQTRSANISKLIFAQIFYVADGNGTLGMEGLARKGTAVFPSNPPHFTRECRKRSCRSASSTVASKIQWLRSEYLVGIYLTRFHIVKEELHKIKEYFEAVKWPTETSH